MQEATDHENAKTIHRALEFDPVSEEFSRGIGNPLSEGVIIIDETSMVALTLMRDLVQAIKPENKLIVIGDPYQLQSITAGAVLADMIRSGKIPTRHLTKIFRQAKGSSIVKYANAINQGDIPVFENDDSFAFHECKTPKDVHDKVVELYNGRTPHDTVVLAGMYKPAWTGINTMNQEIQQLYNPNPRATMKVGDRTFYTGDPMMQLRNDYQKEVFNGDVGYIMEIKDDALYVDFGAWVECEAYRNHRGYIPYGRGDCEQLCRAYASTVHKYQGSEKERVILIVSEDQYLLLSRQWLYTAMTRAKTRLDIVGSRKALNIAVRNNTQVQRYSTLNLRI